MSDPAAEGDPGDEPLAPAGGDAEASDRPSRQELARKRTRRAYRRTLLAKERTFAAWVRTGLASIAVGFGAAQLLPDVEPRWLLLVASGLLVVLGMLAVGFGYWSFRATLQELEEEEGVRPGVPAWVVGGFAIVLVAAAGIGLVLVVR